MSQVHWFPNYRDKFVISGSDISLYQLREREPNYLQTHEIATVKLNNLKYVSQLDYAVNQLSSEIRYQFIKTIAPSYHRNGELLVAAGQANGKVVLCNFLPSQENHIEFTPRQQRPCLTLSWSQNECNLLAMGFDKNKSDHCISIWDIERGNASESSIINLIGLGETAHSICWDKTAKILIAGMSQKYIKMMDLRQSQPIVVTANTRAIQGLQMSANNRFLVSFIDNSVNIWDIRMFEKAVSQFNMQKIISHISWCPTRNNVLTTLHRESYLMNLIDIHWSGIESDMDPHFIKRVISPFEVIDKKNKYNFMTKNVSLDYLSWHPQQAERLLIISNTNILLDFKVSDRVCVTWDNYNKLWSNCGSGIKPVDIGSPSSSPTDSLTSWDLTVNQLREYETTDIADLMRKRVQDNYGQFTALDQNAKHSYVPALYCVWKVLGDMQKSDCLYGIKAILGVPGQDIEPLSETVCESKTWSDFPTSGSIKVYRSGPRETAQIVCGWPFARGGDPAFKSHIQKLCDRKEHTRAAMMACFALKVRYAIEILGRGADEVDDKRNELRMSAIALSGFNLDKSGIWRAQSASAYKQIIDPHLRAIFSFLASESENFENVLNECGVSLGDRIAFACSFLSDQKLNDFVRKTIQICIDDGDLNGLLLTGNNVEGVTLLQSYVDKTDDVQTAALIGCRILPPELINDKRMQCWITNYRDLMDLWGLYDWRAKFDMMNGSIRSPPKSPKSVFLLCSFCGKSVSAALQEEARHRNQVAQPNKLSSCPNCRKPLPRCSLCLLHMGTPMNTLDNSLKSKPFSKWFSWCQTCRHGGHTEHLSEWFASHTECPVTSCTCKCFAMDLPVPKFTGDFSF